MKNFLLHVEFEDGREQHAYQPADSPWGAYEIDNHKKSQENGAWVKLKKPRLQDEPGFIDWGNPFGGGTLTREGLRYTQPIPVDLGNEFGFGNQAWIDETVNTDVRPRGQRITATRLTGQAIRTQMDNDHARQLAQYEEAMRMNEQMQQHMSGEARRRAAQRERDLARARTQQDRPVQQNERPQRNAYQRVRDFFGGNND